MLATLQVQASIGAQVQKTSVVTRSCSAFKPVENPNDHWTPNPHEPDVFFGRLFCWGDEVIWSLFLQLSHVWADDLFVLGAFRLSQKKNNLTSKMDRLEYHIRLWFISFSKEPSKTVMNFVCFSVPSSWSHSQWFSHEVARLSGRMKPLTLSLMTPTYRTSNFISVEIVGFWYIWFLWMWNHVVGTKYPRWK